MEITLDISNNFNSVINFDSFLGQGERIARPTIFFDEPFGFDENFGFELSNFGLNVEDEMMGDFVKKSPHFNDIIDVDVPHYMQKGILVFGKARITVKKLKGLYLRLSGHNGSDESDLYFQCHEMLNKGDVLYEVGGQSAFSPHYTKGILVADRTAQATLRFLSTEYILIDSCDEDANKYYSLRQTPHSYLANNPRLDVISHFTKNPAKMFDFEYRSNRFDYRYDNDFRGMVAKRDEYMG